MRGPEPANYADRYLAAGAQAVVPGEGELALEAILRGGEQGPARLLPDLDAQPWPDRERVDIDQYLRVWREHQGAGSVSVDRKSTRLNSSHLGISYAVFCLKKK